MTTAPKTKPAKKKAKAKKPTSKGRFALIRFRLGVQEQLDAAKLDVSRLTVGLDGTLVARLAADSAGQADTAMEKAVDGFRSKRKTVFDEKKKIAIVAFTASKPAAREEVKS